MPFDNSSLALAGGSASADVSTDKPICIVILALGGEGGGVLADWLVDLAEPNGFYAQTTSIPGVAQRTGATLYYIELFSESAAHNASREPVLALMPMPGQVDLVVASELMEAGRAIERGLVTPERTTLITSTHRVFAMTEKMAMGDGRASSAAFLEACERTAKRVVMADMHRLAEQHGSVISASLFGAIAGSGVLPFDRSQFEGAIRRRGIGVPPSLATFAAGFAAASADAVISSNVELRSVPLSPVPPADKTKFDVSKLPSEAKEIVSEGVRRLTDYQDRRYADDYLARIAIIHELDRTYGDGSLRLFSEAARYLALWMSYEDTIRVADLKIRASRFERVRKEVGIAPDQLLRIREFMHPRVQEIAETVPAFFGRLLLKKGLLRKLLERLTAKGRIVETTSLTGFLLLWSVAALRPWRRHSLRFAAENTRIEAWLSQIEQLARSDYGLAAEVAACPRLIKGYGDTHERGTSNFERIMAAIPQLQRRTSAAAAIARLRQAALADEEGVQLARAISELEIEETEKAIAAPAGRS